MKRKKRSIKRSLLIILIKLSPVIGALIGILVGGLFVILWGENPWVYMVELFKGAFGSMTKIGATLNRTTPLMLAGLGTAIAWKAGAINVGQEGQLFMGGLGAALVAFLVRGLAPAIGVTLTLIGGVLLGMLLASIATAIRLYNGTHELLTTLLLNFIGTLFVSFMTATVLKDPITSGVPQTPVFPESAWLPVWKNLGYTNAGIVIAVVLTILGGFILWKTPLGFKLRMVGISAKATRAAGYKPTWLFILSMLISGGLCGLAGAIEVTASVYHRLSYAFGTNLGFDSLVVALMADLNPFGVLPSALFFGALRTGTNAMQRSVGIPSVILQIIQGVIMIMIVIGFAISKSKKVEKFLRKEEMDALEESTTVSATTASV